MRKEKGKNRQKKKKRANRKYGQAKLKHSEKRDTVLCDRGNCIGGIGCNDCDCIH